MTEVKLGKFEKALETSEKALLLDSSDGKALYRKALALDGCGLFSEARQLLLSLKRDPLHAKEAKALLQLVEVRYEKQNNKQLFARRMFGNGAFSDDRPEPVLQVDEPISKTTNKTSAHPIVPLAKRVLTRTKCEELLADLHTAYIDPDFQKAIQCELKQASYDEIPFLLRLKPLAFEVQKPILKKFGFESSAAGVSKMTFAIREHTADDRLLKETSLVVLQTLHGGDQGFTLVA
jgi:hypothetical protein